MLVPAPATATTRPATPSHPGAALRCHVLAAVPFLALLLLAAPAAAAPTTASTAAAASSPVLMPMLLRMAVRMVPVPLLVLEPVLVVVLVVAVPAAAGAAAARPVAVAVAVLASCCSSPQCGVDAVRQVVRPLLRVQPPPVSRRQRDQVPAVRLRRSPGSVSAASVSTLLVVAVRFRGLAVASAAAVSC